MDLILRDSVTNFACPEYSSAPFDSTISSDTRSSFQKKYLLSLSGARHRASNLTYVNLNGRIKLDAAYFSTVAAYRREFEAL